MTFLVIGTAGSLISGSVFFMLIKESVLTATFGFICLGSILAERPLMFYINRQFVAGDDPVKLEWWNGLWQYPAFRALPIHFFAIRSKRSTAKSTRPRSPRTRFAPAARHCR